MENDTKQNKRRGFFGTLFRGINILRLLIINIVFFFFFFVFLGIIALLPSNKKKEIVRVPSNAVLMVVPTGVAVETENDLLSIAIPGLREGYSQVLISDLTSAITNAAFDRRITSLYFDFSELDGLSSGYLSELGEALDNFKKSGKPIYAYSTSYNLPQFYLASYASRIGLDPFGQVSFAGFGSRPVFYKGLEEKFGVKWNVVHAGAYKGMAETYSREKLSENVRSNLKSMFDNLWQTYIKDVSGNLGIKAEKVNNFAINHSAVLKNYSGDSATAALKEGLVTDIATTDGFAIALGLMDKDSLRLKTDSIDYKNYNLNFKKTTSPNAIAVIHLNGAITRYSANSRVAAASNKIVELFDLALDDPSIRAIVLRIDSGGGEVFASEEIRRAVDRAKQAKLPVIVSMGSVAASGAYWISASADYIFASPYTITGSIGVLASIPTVQDGLEKHLGITSDLVYSGQKPGYSILQNLTAEEFELNQLEVSHIYKTFIEVVSKGRNLPFDVVANLAGGRVYSGEQALKLKLVDQLGSFNDAVEYSAKLVNVKENYSIKEIKKDLPPFESFLYNILKNSNDAKLKQFSPIELKSIIEFLSLNSEQGIYLYNPERLVWKKEVNKWQ